MNPIDRSALRAELRARRRALDARARLLAGERVAAQLRPLLDGGTVAGYWACDGELPLHALLQGAPSFEYCLPQLMPGRQLRFAPWRAGQALRTNRYGIPEPDCAEVDSLAPEQLHWVLLPLIGFTRDGQRLGSGGGYYDRSFAFRRLHPQMQAPRLVGVAYACQEIETMDPQDWDVPLDWIVTESELIDAAALRLAQTES